MQKIMREQLIEKAASLLNNGTVTAVLGWGKGEFDYDVTPAVFKTEEELKAGFVWNDFCGANFSKYLVKKTDRLDGKLLVFLKPLCCLQCLLIAASCKAAVPFVVELLAVQKDEIYLFEKCFDFTVPCSSISVNASVDTFFMKHVH